MNNIEKMVCKQKVFEMIDYMASEVTYNMKRVILNATNEENKYAMKYQVDKDSLNVSFYLYNVVTGTTIEKTLDVHLFSRICSYKESLENYFNDITFEMLELSEK